MQLQPIESTPSSKSSAEITEEEAGALARTAVNLFNAWKLTDSQACTLLGGLSARTWARWKEGNIGRVDRDLKMRLAHLMGIHKGLRYLFKDPARGYAWIKAPNAAFGGKSALEMMLQGELSDLAVMREWLDAERSAW
ncbi:MbcA/ParS/Xre antitoxin family protein [Phyllobacterium sp. 0TCS1.6A]|uniref:MbcA/ParS/Xre antitoxin family protein n=1 Tax=Phyllobacterium sp. 0TCS1.6A TaxID=2995637 RepID=UPI0022653E73|nr:MbcA/ParS/Xre antitoxin family protein [Phyllobacterium sp. 0TCS1.6A]MCX8293040.1 MbcA/ParS/Xre antitoxin family protein [Phyllobacterium sp. 0TCS1.6A]